MFSCCSDVVEMYFLFLSLSLLLPFIRMFFYECFPLFFLNEKKYTNGLKMGCFSGRAHFVGITLSRVHSFVPLPVMHFFSKKWPSLTYVTLSVVYLSRRRGNERFFPSAILQPWCIFPPFFCCLFLFDATNFTSLTLRSNILLVVCLYLYLFVTICSNTQFHRLWSYNVSKNSASSRLLHPSNKFQFF